MFTACHVSFLSVIGRGQYTKMFCAESQIDSCIYENDELRTQYEEILQWLLTEVLLPAAYKRLVSSVARTVQTWFQWFPMEDVMERGADAVLAASTQMIEAHETQYQVLQDALSATVQQQEGTPSESPVWNSSRTVHLTGDVRIPTEQTLVALPGCNAHFDEHALLLLSGGLLAVGQPQPDMIIRFTNNPAKSCGLWGGILVYASSPGLVLKWVALR